MLQVLARATFAFVAAIAFYLTYDLVVTPQLIPTCVQEAVGSSVPAPAPVPPVIPKPWLAHFPAEHWVRDARTKALSTHTGTLLFRTRTDEGQGRIKLAPLALVIDPAGDDDDELAATGSDKHPIILEANEGAILQFDGDLKLGRGGVGRLDWGKLVGPVTIYSGMRAADSSDDLVIRTRDVQLNEQLISTSARVDFAFGRHRGGGRNMEIRLVSRQPHTAIQSPDVPLAGVRSIEILHEVRASLVLDSERAVRPGGGDLDLDMFASASPIEITCRGSFYAQVDELQARFEQDVELVRAEVTGPANQLSCELLTIDFERVPPPSEPAETLTDPTLASDAASSQPGQLRVRRLTAKGAPVIVRLASHNIVARGEQLIVDVPLQQVDLISKLLAEGCSVQRGLSEIRGPRLSYRFDPVDPQGRIGTLSVTGPGSLQAAAEERPDKRFSATWQEGLKIERLENKPVLSLIGSPLIRMTDIGNLQAAAVRVWLEEVPGETRPAGGRQKRRLHVVPRRLAAEGSVAVYSPRLEGHVDQLHLWFTHRDKLVDQASGQTTPGSQPRKPKAAGENPGQPAYLLSGKLLEAELLVAGMLSQSRHVQTRIRNLAIKERVELREQTPAGGQSPLEIRGDRLDVRDADSESARVTLLGRPARITARGATIEAPSLHLSRQENRIWTDEAGELTLPVHRDFDGKPAATPFAVTVAWQRRLDFDGLTTEFTGDVVVEGPHQSLRTPNLKATLNARIDFGEGRARQPLDVAFAECQGGVKYEHQEFDAVGPLSHQVAELEEISIDRESGAIRGSGPGWIRSVRIGKSLVASPTAGVPRGDAIVARGQSPATGVAKPSGSSLFEPPSMGPVGTPADGELEFVQIDFQRETRGNLHRRELELMGDIQIVYGPIRAWHEVLTPIDPQTGNVREGVVVLDCDRLKMIQWPAQNTAKPWIELHANGNVEIEGGTSGGSTFFATANRGTYDGRMDRFILDGMGEYAQLLGKSLTRGMTGRVVARKIEYFRKTGQIRQEHVREKTLLQLPAL